MRKKESKGHIPDVSASDELLGSNSQIAYQLRAFYTSIQDEQIPEKFLLLLDKLDQAEAKNQADQEKRQVMHE